ncbi:hypothetical protein Agub_g7845 [Astrephomene gubernaculifera]|uniref:Uncharacterized protein n=1 Tax=Astrephomene gubernaculifera TaxID=47775 RepID=A0AAD3DQP1_9CHLO|nr:hypothetical protein Agub_g7845 [Astrephomene gubernaculifera]
MAEAASKRGSTIAEKIEQFRCLGLKDCPQRSPGHEELGWKNSCATRHDALPRASKDAAAGRVRPGRPTAPAPLLQTQNQQVQLHHEDPDARDQGIGQRKPPHARPASRPAQVSPSTAAAPITTSPSVSSSSAALLRLAHEHPYLYHAVLSLERGPDVRLPDAVVVSQARARSTADVGADTVAAVAESVGLVQEEENVDHLLARYRPRGACRTDESRVCSNTPAETAVAVLATSVSRAASPRSQQNAVHIAKPSWPQPPYLAAGSSGGAAYARPGGGATSYNGSDAGAGSGSSPGRRSVVAPAAAAASSWPATEVALAAAAAAAKLPSSGKLQKFLQPATEANASKAVCPRLPASAASVGGAAGTSLRPASQPGVVHSAAASEASGLRQWDRPHQQQQQQSSVAPVADAPSGRRSRQGSGARSVTDLLSEPSLSSFYVLEAITSAAEVVSPAQLQSQVPAAKLAEGMAPPPRAAAAPAEAAGIAPPADGVPSVVAAGPSTSSPSISAAATPAVPSEMTCVAATPSVAAGASESDSMQSFAFVTPAAATVGSVTLSAADSTTGVATARRVQFSPNQPQVRLFFEGAIPQGPSASSTGYPTAPAGGTAARATAAGTDASGTSSNSHSAPSPSAVQPAFLLPSQGQCPDPNAQCPTHVFVPADPWLPPALVALPGFEPLPPSSLVTRPVARAAAAPSQRRPNSSSPSPARHSRDNSPRLRAPTSSSAPEDPAMRQEPPLTPPAVAGTALATGPASPDPQAVASTPAPDAWASQAAAAAAAGALAGSTAVGSEVDVVSHASALAAEAGGPVIGSDSELEMEMLAADQVAHEGSIPPRNRLTRLLEEVAAFKRSEGERVLREGERLKVLGELKEMTMDQLEALLGPDSQLLKEANRFKNQYTEDMAHVKADADDHIRMVLDALQAASDSAASVKNAVTQSALDQQEEVLQLLDRLTPQPHAPPPQQHQQLTALQQQPATQLEALLRLLQQPPQQTVSYAVQLGRQISNPLAELLLGNVPSTSDLLNPTWWTCLLSPPYLDTLAACKAAAGAAHSAGASASVGVADLVGPGRQGRAVAAPGPGVGAAKAGAPGDLLAYQVEGLASTVRTSLDDPLAAGLPGAAAEELSVSAITQTARQVSQALDLAVQDYLDRTSQPITTTMHSAASALDPAGPALTNSPPAPPPLPQPSSSIQLPAGWLHACPNKIAIAGLQPQPAQIAAGFTPGSGAEGGPWAAPSVIALSTHNTPIVSSGGAVDSNTAGLIQPEVALCSNPATIAAVAADPAAAAPRQLIAVHGALPSSGVSSAALLDLPSCSSVPAAAVGCRHAAVLGCAQPSAEGVEVAAGGTAPGEGLPGCRAVQQAPSCHPPPLHTEGRQPIPFSSGPHSPPVSAPNASPTATGIMQVRQMHGTLGASAPAGAPSMYDLQQDAWGGAPGALLPPPATAAVVAPTAGLAQSAQLPSFGPASYVPEASLTFSAPHPCGLLPLAYTAAVVAGPRLRSAVRQPAGSMWQQPGSQEPFGGDGMHGWSTSGYGRPDRLPTESYMQHNSCVSHRQEQQVDPEQVKRRSPPQHCSGCSWSGVSTLVQLPLRPVLLQQHVSAARRAACQGQLQPHYSYGRVGPSEPQTLPPQAVDDATTRPQLPATRSEESVNPGLPLDCVPGLPGSSRHLKVQLHMQPRGPCSGEQQQPLSLLHSQPSQQQPSCAAEPLIQQSWSQEPSSVQRPLYSSGPVCQQPCPALPVGLYTVIRSEEVPRAYQTTWEQVRAVYQSQG